MNCYTNRNIDVLLLLLWFVIIVRYCYCYYLQFPHWLLALVPAQAIHNRLRTHYVAFFHWMWMMLAISIFTFQIVLHTTDPLSCSFSSVHSIDQPTHLIHSQWIFGLPVGAVVLFCCSMLCLRKCWSHLFVCLLYFFFFSFQLWENREITS